MNTATFLTDVLACTGAMWWTGTLWNLFGPVLFRFLSRGFHPVVWRVRYLWNCRVNQRNIRANGFGWTRRCVWVARHYGHPRFRLVPPYPIRFSWKTLILGPCWYKT